MTVHLVGAGPGDPGLLTVRGAEVLARADVVIYDRLSAPALLDLVPERCERIYVGKDPSGHSTPQQAINALLVNRGRGMECVVRLKGGDPFVFARGGEELEALAAAGVQVEVVPGITSAIAAPAYAGIPVTRRFSSTAVTVVTGHEDPTKDRDSIDWESLAAVGGTIVVLMGVGNISSISRRLIEGGRSPDTPVAAVRWGTRADQSTQRATLGTVNTLALAPPTTFVIGEVVDHAVPWFESRPLFGRRIVVTRRPEAASRLAARLESMGASVVSLPTIDFTDPPDGGAGLATLAAEVGSYEWVVLSSPNAAERFLAAVGDPRRLGGVKLAAIGPGTAAGLAARGFDVDLVPDRYVAEGMLEVFPTPEPGGRRRVAIPRAVEARDVLVDGLIDLGWEVEVVESYQTVPAAIAPDALDDLAGADAVVFASSSAVRNFVAAVPAEARGEVAVCIGPITAATARDAGFARIVEADPHTVNGLCEAVVGCWPHIGDEGT